MINCAYIHIPFCEKKCKYCAFCSFELLKKKNIYLEALLKEVKKLYKNELLKTIYFGGGTPSLLEIADFKNILDCFNFNLETEITLEINPHNIDLEKIKALKSLGFNRISVGVQSFNDEILAEIGRKHTTKEIFEVLKNIEIAGFENYSIDLMYGLPNQTLQEWKRTLKIAKETSAKHISLYGLKIEEGTYYSKFLPKNLPNDDMQAQMYEIAVNELSKKFIHYEFSNFALNDSYKSKHNSAYWKCEKYYGFGLSASGYLDNGRYTNTFNFADYIKNPLEKKFEQLTRQQKIEEEIFLGLRLLSGIDFNYIDSKYNINLYEKYKTQFDKYLLNNLMQKTPNGVKLTQKGILLSNEILCDFI